MELIKLNISSSFVTVTHHGKPLTMQIVPLLDQSNLFEVSVKIMLDKYILPN